MYVRMYNVYMSFPQMRHCKIPPLHQLGICHNNVTVDNTFPTCFGGVQVVRMYVCMYVSMRDLRIPHQQSHTILLCAFLTLAVRT